MFICIFICRNNKNYFNYLCNKKILKKYLFHYSETYYRPLWTYVIDDNKKNIICYFYSAYDSPTNSRTSEIGHFYEFGNISWPTILVWDETQNKKISKYVRKDIVDIDIINTGHMVHWQNLF